MLASPNSSSAVLVSLLIAAVSATARVQAQTKAEDCIALKAELQKLEHDWDLEVVERGAQIVIAADGYVLAGQRAGVLTTPAALGISEVMQADAFRNSGMLAFATRYGLGDGVKNALKAAKQDPMAEPLRFYNFAVATLRGRESGLATDVEFRWEEFTTKKSQLQNRLAACDPPPLDLPRHPDGRPLITVATISRWMDGLFAEQASGVSPWRAARMSQSDFNSLSNRIREYSGRPDDPPLSLAQYFTADELTALRARRGEIEDVLKKTR